MAEQGMPGWSVRLAFEDFYEVKRAVLAKGAQHILENFDTKPVEQTRVPKNPISRWFSGSIDITIVESMPMDVTEDGVEQEYFTVGTLEIDRQLKADLFQSAVRAQSKAYFIGAYPTYASAEHGKNRDAVAVSARSFNVADLLEDETFRNLNQFQKRLSRLLPLFGVSLNELSGAVLDEKLQEI